MSKYPEPIRPSTSGKARRPADDEEAQAKAAREAARSTCEHGVRPWYNCEACAASSNYGFKGNFR